jgi:hypothetical protein
MIKSSRNSTIFVAFVIFVVIVSLIGLMKPNSFFLPAVDAYPPPPTSDTGDSNYSYPGPSTSEKSEPTPEATLASGPKTFFAFLPVVRKLANPKKGLGWSRIEDQRVFGNSS